jgi:hypothetical protein
VTKDEIDQILREAKSQDSDFAEPHYKVWYTTFKGDAGSKDMHLLAAEGLPIFLARVLVREIKKRGYAVAWIEVE